jgi:ankyrin repeat protein
LKLVTSQKDFDINAKADDGSTALSLAIREGFHELEKVLRAHGAVDEDRPEDGLIEEE